MERQCVAVLFAAAIVDTGNNTRGPLRRFLPAVLPGPSRRRELIFGTGNNTQGPLRRFLAVVLPGPSRRRTLTVEETKRVLSLIRGWEHWKRQLGHIVEPLDAGAIARVRTDGKSFMWLGDGGCLRERAPLVACGTAVRAHLSHPIRKRPISSRIRSVSSTVTVSAGAGARVRDEHDPPACSSHPESGASVGCGSWKASLTTGRSGSTTGGD